MGRGSKGIRDPNLQKSGTHTQESLATMLVNTTVSGDQAGATEVTNWVKERADSAKEIISKTDDDETKEKVAIPVTPSDHAASAHGHGSSTSTNIYFDSTSTNQKEVCQELSEEINRMNRILLSPAKQPYSSKTRVDSVQGAKHLHGSLDHDVPDVMEGAASPSDKAVLETSITQSDAGLLERCHHPTTRLLDESSHLVAATTPDEIAMKIYAGVKAFDYDMLSQRYQFLDSEHKRVQDEHQQLQSRYYDLESKNTLLQAVNDILRADCDDLAKYKSHCMKLQTTVDTLIEDNECLKLTESYRSRHANKLRADLEREQAEKLVLQARIDDITKQNVQLHMRISSLDSGSSREQIGRRMSNTPSILPGDNERPDTFENTPSPPPHRPAPAHTVDSTFTSKSYQNFEGHPTRSPTGPCTNYLSQTTSIPNPSFANNTVTFSLNATTPETRTYPNTPLMNAPTPIAPPTVVNSPVAAKLPRIPDHGRLRPSTKSQSRGPVPSAVIGPRGPPAAIGQAYVDSAQKWQREAIDTAKHQKRRLQDSGGTVGVDC